MLDKLRFSPYLAQVIVIRRCNLSCGYCSEFDTKSDPIPTDVIKARLDKLKALGTLSVEFSGGEPMLHPDIFEIIRYARSLRFNFVQMISNAYLFNREKVEKLNEAGLQRLQISVDGVEPNETTVKVLKPLRPKLEVVAKHAKFDVILSSVVGAAPDEEVEEVVEFAKDQGFIPRVLLLHGDDGQLSLDKERLATYHRIQRSLGWRFKESGDYRTRLITEGSAPFKCRSGSRYLYIDEFGLVRYCSQQLDFFQKPLADYTFADLREHFHTPKDCNVRCTVGCARTCSNPDEWRPQGPVPGVDGKPRPPRPQGRGPLIELRRTIRAAKRTLETML